MAIILGDSFAYPSNFFSCSTNADGTVVLVAEASDLRYNEPRQIYDDACDVGIAVRSEKTGRLVRFYLSKTDYTPDGEEIVGWYFEPIEEDKRRVANASRTKVLIIND